MIDHLGICVSDYQHSKVVFQHVLAPLTQKVIRILNREQDNLGYWEGE